VVQNGFLDRSERVGVLILRRIAVVALFGCLMGAGLGSTATAAPVGCGSVITQSTTLTTDIGPCNQGGLVIGADNVTLDLGGHTVFGKPRPGDGVGISIPGHSGVTVRNGTVRLFDAGVGVQSGGGNTVTGVTARDNVGSAKFNSKFGVGDGIEINLSSNNTVSNNTVVQNGPFSGIGVLGDAANPATPSSGNVITGNRVVNNDVAHDGVNEDDGIRVEGPNATNNTVQGNTVRGNGLDGIALFADQLTGFPNSGNTVAGNIVEGNGFHDKGHRKGDGIVLFGVPANPNVHGADASNVRDNTVHSNAANGIRVASKSNTITSNDATGNAAFPGVVAFDLNDQNPDCDANSWTGNVFNTRSRACIN
jgi:large repetitive protein